MCCREFWPQLPRDRSISPCADRVAFDVHINAACIGNHNAIFKAAGLNVSSYTYYNPETIGLDLEGMKKDLNVKAPHPPHVPSERERVLRLVSDD